MSISSTDWAIFGCFIGVMLGYSHAVSIWRPRYNRLVRKHEELMRFVRRNQLADPGAVRMTKGSD